MTDLSSFSMQQNMGNLTGGAMPTGSSKSSSNNPFSEGYTCRVLRANISEPEDLLLLESVLTKGICNTDGSVVILKTDTTSFEDQYWFILTYLERVSANA